MSKTPEDVKQKNRAWYAANRDVALAQQKEYAREHAEERREYSKRYRSEHIEYFKAYEAARKEKRSADRREQWKDPVYRENRLKAVREWKANNKEWCVKNKHEWDKGNREWIKEYGRKYREDNTEVLSQRFRDWQRRNPEYMRAYGNRRRAIKAGSSGQFTTAEIADLWVKQKGLCVYFSVCGNTLQPNGFRGTHRDHIQPLIPKDPSQPPGQNTIDNIQLLCRSCNQKKNNNDPYAFTQSHEGRLFPDLPIAPKKAKKR